MVLPLLTELVADPGTLGARANNMRCNWVRVYREIADELRTQPNLAAVRYSLQELFTRSGGDDSPADFFDRGFWSNNQRGVPAYTTLRDAGLVVGFEPDEQGLAVTHATFRLNAHS